MRNSADYFSLFVSIFYSNMLFLGLTVTFAEELTLPNLDDITVYTNHNSNKDSNNEDTANNNRREQGVGHGSDNAFVQYNQNKDHPTYSAQSNSAVAPFSTNNQNSGSQVDSSALDEFGNFYGKNVSVIHKVPPIPSLEKVIGNWFVLKTSKDSPRDRGRCYIVSYPYETISNHKTNRKPYLMIVLDKKKVNVFMAAGYEFAKGSKAFVSIDGNQFLLNTNIYIAMPNTMEVERDFNNNLLYGAKVLIYSRSSVGTYSVDSYSLENFLDAYKKMMDLCRDGDK